MAKQSEWSVMRDQDKWLTVPLRGYIYICIWMLWKGVFAGSARRTLWIGVTGRYSSFCLSSIIIEGTSIFFFLNGDLIRGSVRLFDFGYFLKMIYLEVEILEVFNCIN